jgi:thiamine-phosphate pyrophosphorylase
VILPDPPILVITDRARRPEGLEARAAALFRGGCRWLSVREKDMAPAARRDILESLVRIGGRYGAVIGVHDDIAAASALGIGLHLPAAGDAPAARRESGSRLLGQSCHDAAEIDRAAAAGVDYVTLSPFFVSVSKPGYHPRVDPAQMSAIVARSAVPVIALGGVTDETMAGLPASIAGCAIMGQAMTTPDAESWFEKIVAQWRIFRMAAPQHDRSAGL